MFAIYGIHVSLFADNVSFDSLIFREFSKERYFEVKTISPYHSQSNDQMEKLLDLVRATLRKP